MRFFYTKIYQFLARRFPSHVETPAKQDTYWTKAKEILFHSCGGNVPPPAVRALDLSFGGPEFRSRPDR